MELCYLIRSVDRNDDLAFHVKDWAAAFRPSSVVAEVIPGWGNLRLRILGGEVSLADEMPGVQVCFEAGGIRRAGGAYRSGNVRQRISHHSGAVRSYRSLIWNDAINGIAIQRRR